MNINYISLGSFCHPKIFLRNTNREILKSLPCQLCLVYLLFQMLRLQKSVLKRLVEQFLNLTWL